MQRMVASVVSDPAKQPWFWQATVITVGVLLALNVLAIVFVYARRVRESERAHRAERFRQRFGPLVERFVAGELGGEELRRLRGQVEGLNELERPLAAEMLIETLRVASGEERRRIRALAEEVGAVELLERGTRRRRPWRRALAIQTLGLLGERAAVPLLLERLDDRNRYVRES
jgi:hypothetical protein